MGLLKRQMDVERNSAKESDLEAEMRDGKPESMAPMPARKQTPLNQIKEVSSPEISVNSSDRLSKRHRYSKFFDNF